MAELQAGSTSTRSGVTSTETASAAASVTRASWKGGWSSPKSLASRRDGGGQRRSERSAWQSEQKPANPGRRGRPDGRDARDDTLAHSASSSAAISIVRRRVPTDVVVARHAVFVAAPPGRSLCGIAGSRSRCRRARGSRHPCSRGTAPVTRRAARAGRSEAAPRPMPAQARAVDWATASPLSRPSSRALVERAPRSRSVPARPPRIRGRPRARRRARAAGRAAPTNRCFSTSPAPIRSPVVTRPLTFTSWPGAASM